MKFKDEDSFSCSGLLVSADSSRALLSGTWSEHGHSTVSGIEVVQKQGWFLKLLSSSYVPSEFLSTGCVKWS